MADGDPRAGAAEWFVVGPNRKPFGPYTIEKLRQYVADGRISRETLVHRRGTADWVRASTVPGLFPSTSVPSSEVVKPAVHPPSIPVPRPVAPECPTCRAGVLTRTRLYRMSTPVVAIGYILLVPSVLGMVLTVLFSGFMILFPIVGGAAAGDADTVAAGGLLAPCFALNGVCGVIVWFVLGLLGWILIMKKTVLRCSACQMTVSAA